MASPSDSDNEPWDEPLKRRCNATQTDPFKASMSTQTLITIPFCRDPTQPVPILPPDDQEFHSRSRSPKLPASKKPVRIASPQSYYQPPAPWGGNADDTNTLENSSFNTRRPNVRSHFAIDNSDLPDPISELHALAKLSSDSRDNEDDPPFNFQAMLKRTPKNRASMKRQSDRRDSSDDYGRSESDCHSVYNSASNAGSKKHVTLNSEPTATYAYRSSQDYDGSKVKRGPMKNDGTETIEIAPGITVEGEVADL